MVMGRRTIAVVSGLPRSGTSMMMRMLEAGGMEVLTDHVREADKDNPEGYYEFERVKQIEHDQSWVRDAEGKVVKIISQLLHHLPSDRAYKIVFMRRDMDEILASQRQMLLRRGEDTDKIADEKLAELFRHHVEDVQGWLNGQPNIDVIYVMYNSVLARPQKEARRIAAFFDVDLDVDAMAAVVDPTLYRQRS